MGLRRCHTWRRCVGSLAVARGILVHVAAEQEHQDEGQNSLEHTPGYSCPVAVPMPASSLRLLRMPATATACVLYTPQSGVTGDDVIAYRICDKEVPAECSERIDVAVAITP
jgi:hypothetical protein